MGLLPYRVDWVDQALDPGPLEPLLLYIYIFFFCLLFWLWQVLLMTCGIFNLSVGVCDL